MLMVRSDTIVPVGDRWSPDADDMICKDCRFRDTTRLIFCDHVFYIGVTEPHCARYPDQTHPKPAGVFVPGGTCKYYEKEHWGITGADRK